MKKLLLITFLCTLSLQVFSQIPAAEELVGIHVVTEAEMNGIANPIEGTLVYNSDKASIFQHDGTIWKNVTSISKLVDNGNDTYTFTNNDGVAITFNPNDVQTILSSNNTIAITQTGNDYDLSVPKINKSYVQVYKTTNSFDSGNATLLNLFPEVTIQAGKKVELTVQIPVRNDDDGWAGIYININAKVNGTWYNLGNGGYNAMLLNARPILTCTKVMLLDFITNLGLPEDQDYTLQFEILARTYQRTITVNGGHDTNQTANGLNSRGGLQTWASDQHYTNLVIKELDR